MSKERAGFTPPPASTTLYSKDRPERFGSGMACPCGGYADRQHDMTQEEVIEMQQLRGFCGRSHECCARAFKCRLCGSRVLANAQSPEAE